MVQHVVLQADGRLDRHVRQHRAQQRARSGRLQRRPVVDQEHEDRGDADRSANRSVQHPEPPAVRQPQRPAGQLGVRHHLRDAREPVVRAVRDDGAAGAGGGEDEILTGCWGLGAGAGQNQRPTTSNQ